MTNIVEKINVYCVVSGFTDVGMSVFPEKEILGLKVHDLLNIANYYSIILNASKNVEALYGALPVAYRTDILLYFYTFQIINEQVKDQRVIDNENRIPAYLLIFIPTFAEKYAAVAKEKMATAVKNWKKRFTKIDEISESDLNRLCAELTTIIIQEHHHFEDSSVDEAKIVLGKSLELLNNLAVYNEHSFNLLLSGPQNFSIFLKHLFFQQNIDLITYYNEQKHGLEIQLDNVKITYHINETEPSINKFIQDKLNGVFIISNNLEEQTMNNIANVLKGTKEKCVIALVLLNQSNPIKETKLPELLQKSVNRTISIIDVIKQEISPNLALIDFFDKIIESSQALEDL